MKKNRKGFTLIEILIVVVILAILATLVLPRMLAQPEGALIAEANQVLGALVRAEENYMALRDDFTAGLAMTDGSNSSQMSLLGMQPIVAGSRFTYACDTLACRATRAVGGGTIVVNYTSNPKVYSCTTPYTVAANAQRGCVRV
jgi:prepilin-type N-terminal cleavage/methylation domain-containing protein